MIVIGLNEGARTYTNFECKAENEMDNISFSNFSGYGQDFNVYNNIVNASVGSRYTYSNITRLNKNTISMLFDYIVETVNVFGKTTQTGGNTTELTNTNINIIDKGSGYSEVQIKTNLNTSLDDVFLLVYINGNFSPINYYDYLQNLTNCNSNLNENNPNIVDDKIKEGEQLINIVAVDGYVFNDKPYLTMNGTVYFFDLINDNKQAILTIEIDGDIEVNAIAIPSIYLSITGSIENATCNYNDGDLVTGDVIISAKEGYSFKETYTFNDGLYVKNVENNVTFLKIEYSPNYYSIILDNEYKATKDIEQIGSFINLYLTNQDELSQLSKKRFITNDGIITDYGQFINSLYILPFEIPNDLIGDKSNIILGNFNSEVESTLINSYMFTIDGGTIEIPLKYNNIYDFVNTECILHLPFLDKIYLDTEYVIGQTINIEFLVELYSSNLTINIRSSFNNEIIESVNGLIGMNIPFMQKVNNSVLNSLSNIYRNSINRCFIEVNRNIPYTKDNNIFGGSVIEYGKIGDYEGYLECDNVVLETSANNQEQEEIKNLLRNGVFI